jgi:hypothetical protein
MGMIVERISMNFHLLLFFLLLPLAVSTDMWFPSYDDDILGGDEIRLGISFSLNCFVIIDVVLLLLLFNTVVQVDLYYLGDDAILK